MDTEPSDELNPMNPEDPQESSDTRELKPGETFGNFRVMRCLSVGLIADYYTMQHVRDLHDITVGIFHRRTAEDSKFLKRLKILQKSLQDYGHPSIPKIKDCALIDDRHCIFMEPVEGVSLSDYYESHHLPDEVGVDPQGVTRILAELFGALGYAHSQGLDHRDLNSDLIYIREDGSIQVLGIGIKLTLGGQLYESIVSASVSPLDHPETVGRLDSFDIISPEYQAGSGEDSRADIYAVGMLGYWLITGHSANSSDLQPASSLVEDLPVEWDAFFAQCVERDVSARFQSCKGALVGLQSTEPEPDTPEAGFIQRQIDRVKVPRSIESRGGSVVRVYRLCLIGIVGLVLTGLAATYLVRAFEPESTDYERVIARKVQGEDLPNLVVSVIPNVAKVEISGSKESFIASDGLVPVLVQSGDYQLKVTAPNYIEQSVSVTIPGANAEPVKLSVELQPALVDFKMSAEPGASISVVDASGAETALGVTDGEGELYIEKGILGGVYDVHVQKEGYETLTLEGQEVILGQNYEGEAELIALPSSVTVRTNPLGASVFIGGKLVGVSPLTVDSLIAGDHLIEVRLDEYRALDRQVSLERGEGSVVDFGEMQLRAGSVDLKVGFLGAKPESVPGLLEGLLVEIDGKAQPYREGRFEQIREGACNLKLVHPLYAAQSVKLDVFDLKTVTAEVEMSPLPGVVVFALPPGLEFTVKVNGREVTPVEGQVELPVGSPVGVVLDIKDHLSMKRQLSMEPNQRVRWEVSPVPIPGPVEGESWSVPYLGSRLAWITSGSYLMGSPMQEVGRLPNEGPQTQVRFTKGFWAGAYEVTQGEYFAIVGRNPAGFVESKKPVEGVSWADAKTFCELLTLNEKEAGRLPSGFVYRLPTEAEWEYLARAGTQTPFSFGERADPSKGNFSGHYPKISQSDGAEVKHYGTEPVGSYPPNAFGLYDVHGNVQEWTLDAYNGRFPGGSLTDPSPRREGPRIVVRGGSWKDYAKATRSSIRQEIKPEVVSDSIGFRFVLAPEK